MSDSLILYCSIFVFFIMFLVIHFVRRNKINIKYSVVWIWIFGVLFVFLLVPGLLGFITKLLGFNLSSNMIFSLLIGSLVIINIAFTVILSSQDRKIRLLVQEISLLKEQKVNRK